MHIIIHSHTTHANGYGMGGGIKGKDIMKIYRERYYDGIADTEVETVYEGMTL